MICLAAGAVLATLGAGPVTLAWTHSVERTRWREVWRQTSAGLVLEEASVQGSGAGMDPPQGALLGPHGWTWRPALPPQREIVLRRSGATADWEVCVQDRCRAMDAYLPPEADPVRLSACP